MSYQHKDIAKGRWDGLSFLEQTANIGSEVESALIWKSKNNSAYCQRAAERALELADLTLGAIKKFSRLRELARMREALREALVDYFFGGNLFASTAESRRSCFSHFTYAARKNY